MSCFDVVVVGAGNAGLAAALQCAQAGKKTLLIEKHNLPGGCATSFRRGRFEIEPSLHELCELGSKESPGGVRALMDQFGIKVDWVEVKDCFRVVGKFSDGTKMDVTMPSGVEAFISKMEEYVPGSREKMEKLFDLFKEIEDGIDYITFSSGNADPKVLAEKYPNMLTTGSYPTKKVFDALGIPQKCQDILSTYWSYLGVDMEHLSFIHYAMMVRHYVDKSAYIPSHTSHEISNAMIERFREMGGEVWYNCRAEKFLFKDDKCVGVETSLGKIDCKYVLANINPDIIYGKMMPKELVPEREKKLSAARDRNYGGRMFTAYFCMDKTAEELGIHDYSIFLPGYADSREEFENMMKGMESNEYSIFLCYNVANPKISPEGTCMCSFTTFGSPNDWNDLKQEDYVKFKNKITEKMMNTLKDKTGIDLFGHIEEMSVATPWTFARYLGTPEGSTYGHLTTDWDSMMARMMSIGEDYKVKGLLPIGAGGPRGDGYSSAYYCGQMMAGLAIAEMAACEGGDR